MSDGKNADHFNGKWAIVTVDDRLPPLAEQIARARAFGVRESTYGRHDISALLIDDVTSVKRTTNWTKHLPMRAKLIEAGIIWELKGDQVWFCTPLCVGFSEKHARETVEGLWAGGMEVYVHTLRNNGPACYAPGDDLTTLLEMVAYEQNAAAVRLSRARKS
ncbi:hypothetical protein [Mesobacterium pallidum]|uniref:hypothetical protein n=1 Tax=Mesobacterium pallidum TaxID=2872037 RepID=UPI001EE242E9|nr:hypothetical protein [Mesobacterium pallidum]